MPLPMATWPVLRFEDNKKKVTPMADLEAIASIIIKTLSAFEETFRRFHPFTIPQLREGLLAHEQALQNAWDIGIRLVGNVENDDAGQQLLSTCELLLEAIRTFGLGHIILQGV